MKLFDDNDDDEVDSDDDSAKKYVQPSQEEFEIFLAGTPWSWDIAEQDVGEVVYKSDDFSSREAIDVRIFSTIDERTAKARPKDSDAIRTVVWNNNEGSPVGGRRSTYRIKTWRKNLSKKLKSLSEDIDEYVQVCDECGSLMVIRNGEYGEFYGCSSYPSCTETRQIDD